MLLLRKRCEFYWEMKRKRWLYSVIWYLSTGLIGCDFRLIIRVYDTLVSGGYEHQHLGCVCHVLLNTLKEKGFTA